MCPQTEVVGNLFGFETTLPGQPSELRSGFEVLEGEFLSILRWCRQVPAQTNHVGPANESTQRKFSSLIGADLVRR